MGCNIAAALKKVNETCPARRRRTPASALALFDLGRFSEVEKFYQRALDKNPENLDALAKIANVLEEKGERSQALELVEDALDHYADSVKLRLMKLKLSLQVVPPPQLAQQIDDMIEIMTTKTNQ